MVAVTVLTVLLLGVPLAVVARRWYEDRNTVDLQRRAAQAAADVSVDPGTGVVHVDEDDAAEAEDFGVYDAGATLVAGRGPTTGDTAVKAALTGSPAFDHSTESVVYAVPITARGDDQVGAVVRVAEPDAEVDASVHRAWMVMTAVAGVALLIAWLFARALARRLAEPVQRLAESAERLGAGGVVLTPEPTGVTEIDLLGDTLATSSARIAEVLARERAFTADVSHQLRTPLTGLRLMLESEPSPVTPRALAEVDRLQRTVEHLLALARDGPTGDHQIDIADTVRGAGERWNPLVAAQHRVLIVETVAEAGTVRASTTAVGQIIDVLVDNALVHGAGSIRLTCRQVPGGIAIDVADEGAGIRIEDTEQIFQRRHGTGHGIGLTLARSLAEADGGRLLLTNHRPARFTMFIPTTAHEADAPARRSVDDPRVPAETEAHLVRRR
jgi:signal transduction histidine kinase